MSSFVWMKFLESAPERYDKGIQLLSRGRISEVYEDIADRTASPGKRILDIGCGTGGVSLACAARGARVVGIDTNAQMLEIASAKAGAEVEVEWLELGVAEIEDRFDEASFDAVVSSLTFSELSSDEQAYAVRISRSRLVPGGRLVVADERLPSNPWARATYLVRRAPLQALTYLLAQTTTRPVTHLAERIREAGFGLVEEERLWGDTFCIVSAVRDEA